MKSIKYITLDDFCEIFNLRIKRKSVLERLRRNKMPTKRCAVIALEDLDKAARKVISVLPSDVVRKGIKVLSTKDYAAKYGLNEEQIYSLWDAGKVDGFMLLHRLFVVDAPPRASSDYDVLRSLDENALLRRVLSEIEKVMVRPVGLVKIQPRNIGRRALAVLAKRRMLYRFGKFFYVLHDKLGRAPQEIKLIYPNPTELMVPKTNKDYSWHDGEEITNINT